MCTDEDNRKKPGPEPERLKLDGDWRVWAGQLFVDGQADVKAVAGYRVEIALDENGDYLAVVPAFDGKVTASGDTSDDALREITVAVGLALDVMRELGVKIPAPDAVIP